MEPEIYQIEYEEFIKEYKTMEVSGEHIGRLISRMAMYFAQYNKKFVYATRDLTKVAAEIEGRNDDNGKAISSSKAKVITEATDSAHAERLAKMHVQNIEQYINALKSHLKGATNEFAYQQ